MATATETHVQQPLELQARSSPARSTSPTSSQAEDQASRLERLRTREPIEDDGLPPQDRGRKAWTFIAAAFVLE